MLAQRDGDRIVLHCEFRDRDLVRQLPGARWSPETKTWTAALSWTTCLTMRGVFGARLEIADDLAQWAREEMVNRITPSLDLRERTNGFEDPEGLFAFQQVGTRWLGAAGHALLADEMGAGKSVQTVVHLREGMLDDGPVVIICPNSVKMQWKKEFTKWWPGLTDVRVIGGAANARRKLLEPGGDVYIMNWESVRLHSRLAPYGSIRLVRCQECGGHDEKITAARCEVHKKELQLIKPTIVVADEAHRMKDPKAKQTRAVWAVGHQESVVQRIALTGTPIANAPDDLWSILHFLEPKEWPSRGRYIDRYCLQSWSPFGGLDVIGIRPEVHTEFRRAFEPRFRRMPKALVLDQLPPKVRETRHVEMSTKQAKAYAQMEEGMIAELGGDDGDIVLAPNTLTRSLRLLQFASAYAEVNDEGKLRLSEPSSKLDALDEVLGDLGFKPRRPGEPLVVFALSRQLIMLAAARLEKSKIAHGLIVGGLSDAERVRALENFEDGTTSVLLLTVQAGGEGLNLTRAGHCVFLQRSWSMLQNRQAEDRVHRIGSEQHDSVHIIDLVTPNTIEEEQAARLQVKFTRLQEIVRDRELLRNDPVALARLEAEEMTITTEALL